MAKMLTADIHINYPPVAQIFNLLKFPIIAIFTENE